MSDPTQVLTTGQIRDALADEWRQLRDRLRARFRTGDFATGLTLVNEIGQLAQAADHHPDIVLHYSEVIVTLTSHDAGGVTERDLGLARQIGERAAALEITADVSGLTELELGLDTTSGERLGPFYAALLGAALHDGEPVDPSGQVPGVWWQGPGNEGSVLPDQSFEQRWHFDVWVPHDEAGQRLQAVLDAGGTLISDAEAPSFWVIEDADGNRACICTTAGR